jgi:hypothetical protein
MEVSTVYLNGPIAPGGKDWHKGYIESNNSTGVTINDRDDGHRQPGLLPGAPDSTDQLRDGVVT